jgi:hypothetical protein
MFGSEMLDAAIGLFLVYFLFSVFCSTLNEWIVGHMRGLRARMLEIAIERLLASRKSKAEFYALPIIKCLADRDSAKPSYISSTIFVDALLTLLHAKAVESAPASVNAGSQPNEAKQPEGTVVTSIETAASELDKLRGLLEKNLSGLPVQPILLSLLRSVKDMDEACKKIEAWFDEGMDRATGWYKKRVRVWTAGLAVGVVVFFNADTLTITHELIVNSRLRATLVASAEAAVKTPSTSNDPNAASNTVASIQAQITDLGLPIGWAWHTKIINPGANPPTTVTTLLRPGEDWPTKIGGLLITVCAVSLGAPFWFDLLGRLTNLRAAGKKPEKEKDKKAK